LKRLKFKMWKDRDGNIFSRFTDGNGRHTDSCWSSPPSSIDHVGPEYLKQPHRHPNVRNDRHIEFTKCSFKEEVRKFISHDQGDKMNGKTCVACGEQKSSEQMILNGYKESLCISCEKEIREEAIEAFNEICE
jgi:hypothetical protein